MVDFEYASRNINGVLRMAFGKEDWREYVDRSVDGVFKSFWAIPLTAPFSLLAFVSARRAAENSPDIASSVLTTTPLGVLITAEFVGFFLDWALSIGAIIFIARTLNAGSRIADAIIGFNWTQLIAAAIISIPVFVFGLTNDTNVFSLLYLPAVIVAIVLLWRVMRSCLPLSIGMTIALLATLMLIGIIANATVSTAAIFIFQLVS